MRVTYVKKTFKSTVSFYIIFNSYGLVFIRFYRQYRHLGLNELWDCSRRGHLVGEYSQNSPVVSLVPMAGEGRAVRRGKEGEKLPSLA